MPKIPRLLIVIFALALFIRLFQLNTFPLGFHVDEAKVAWESLSILKTGRDDHGNFLNLYYNSFGDYRPIGIFYTTIPSLIIFGRTNFAVRFPSALIGALTVFPIYFFTLQVLRKNKKPDDKDMQTALITSFILSIIPWHIATSRATSEVVISCFLIITSLSLLAKKPKLSFITLALSFLFYHSARIMGPILMLIWITYLWENLNKKTVIKGFLLTSFLSLALLLSPTGLARYSQVKLSSPTIRDVFIDYSSYFDPNFLIGDLAKPFRYTTGDVGIVSIPIFIAFLLGIYAILKSNKNRVVILLFALGPIPASLTLEDSPNLHRAFFMVPFLVIIASIGLYKLNENHKTIFKLFAFSIIVTFITFSINYLNTNQNFAFGYRDPQTKSLALYIANVQKNYDKIFVTNDPDSPYPWYSFFNNLDPKDVNPNMEKQENGKWEYKNIVWENTKCPAAAAFDLALKDKSLSKIMVIDNGACFTDFNRVHSTAKIIKEFNYNGKVNYRVWEYSPRG
ncbi:MAG TPA: DUF6056 family protein [Candidatus Saccharimonadales bacterium]|nr:DUF6056 family protein [Candidatus Saccharimonadales bacterium]